ncbi:hypothetical protein CS542_07165 [Pedobacter sp. IW39]|nr:hypothetical protein CS542_07165 [Pedobacter sp. IW39]
MNLTQTEALAELWNDLAAQELTIHHIIYCRALSSQPLTVKYEAIETQFYGLYRFILPGEITLLQVDQACSVNRD